MEYPSSQVHRLMADSVMRCQWSLRIIRLKNGSGTCSWVLPGKTDHSAMAIPQNITRSQRVSPLLLLSSVSAVHWWLTRWSWLNTEPIWMTGMFLQLKSGGVCSPLSLHCACPLQTRQGLYEGILVNVLPGGGSENSNDQIYCMLLWSRRKKKNKDMPSVIKNWTMLLGQFLVLVLAAVHAVLIEEVELSWYFRQPLISFHVNMFRRQSSVLDSSWCWIVDCFIKESKKGEEEFTIRQPILFLKKEGNFKLD